MEAIFLYGPCGVGKSTLAKALLKENNYVHCNADYFKEKLGPVRTKERSKKGEQQCFEFTKKQINLKKNVICEAMYPFHVEELKILMKNKEYRIIEFSLIASIETCLKRNKKRILAFDDKVIHEAHKLYTLKIGHIIETDKKTSKKILEQVKKLLQ